MISSYFQSHPFPVVAHFERVVAVSFAFPEEVLAPLVPEGLTLDAFEGLGFITVAMVWTREMRPAGFPRLLGRDFFLAGYRIFTRMQHPSGRSLRGLRILRSETDKRGMVFFGNLMTRYNYRWVDLHIEQTGPESRVVTKLADGSTTMDLTFDAETADAPLPGGSPFADWREARRFAGPMPFTFSPERDGRFVVIEGRRTDWVPRPIRVGDWQVGLFDQLELQGATPVLANAFAVENIDYRWSRGQIVRPGGAQ